MDIGAPSSVIGIRERRRIYSAAGVRMKELKKSKRRFRFCDSVFQSLGKISLIYLRLHLETPIGMSDKYVQMDMVSADVPALDGLDFLDYHSLLVDTVTNRLTKRVVVPDDDGQQYVMDEWHMPPTQKHSFCKQGRWSWLHRCYIRVKSFKMFTDSSHTLQPSPFSSWWRLWISTS